MKKLWILAPLLLLLTACAPQTAAQEGWGPAALEHFRLTEADVAGLEEMAQTLDQTAQGEEASLHLTQSIGDGKTIYLFYELTLPEGWGEQLEGEEVSLGFDVACQFSDKPLASDPLTGYHPYNSRRTSHSEPEGNRVTGFFSFDFLEPYTGRGLTLLLGNLSLEATPPVEASCGDLLSLSWTPTNQAATVTATAPPQGVECTVTPLWVKAKLWQDTPPDPSASYYGMGTLFHLSLEYTDGRASQSQVLGFGSGDERSGYSYTLEAQPKPGGIFRPELVETVTIEDVSFRFGP